MLTSINKLLFTLRDGGGQGQASEVMARCADGGAAKPGREHREAIARMKRLPPCMPPSPG
ncbi:MAG: hypothetical protein IPP03_07125 [Dechloromonas sp.]|jgi:hypothetical protein|nr:hypothetical protein [Candidatus Dechloromonas phosphoritropha]MBP8789298.1 hypothetical protein [Azonexus sp.]MBP9226584.1 hypothetical protein [Azonexus sp.]